MLVATTYMVIKQSFVLKITLFSLGLARSPMATSSCRQAGVFFLKLMPGLATFHFYGKVKKHFYLFFKNCFPKQPWLLISVKGELILKLLSRIGERHQNLCEKIGIQQVKAV